MGQAIIRTRNIVQGQEIFIFKQSCGWLAFGYSVVATSFPPPPGTCLGARPKETLPGRQRCCPAGLSPSSTPAVCVCGVPGTAAPLV